MSLETWFFPWVSLLGGASLILVGLKFLSEGLQVLLRPTLRKVLRGVGNHVVSSSWAGATTSFIVQSSYTSSIMALGYAGSGLFRLGQLVPFLLGAQLGTLVTVWLFMLDVSHLHLFMLGLGVLPMFYSRGKFLPHVGRVIFAVGLLWLGYGLIHQGLITANYLRVWMVDSLALTEQSAVGFWTLISLALAMALVLRSSIVAIAIVMVLTAQEFMTPLAGCVLVLGFNWGLSVPLLWASRYQGLVARQGALTSFLIQTVVLVVTFFFFKYFFIFTLDTLNVIAGVPKTGHEWNEGLIPATHVMFNLLIFAGFLAMGSPMTYLSQKLIPAAAKQKQKFRFAASVSNASAVLAVEQARQEVVKMVAMVSSMLNLAHEKAFPVVGKEENLENKERIIKYEIITDNFHSEATDFLTYVMEMRLAPEQAQEVRVLLRLLDDLENIADYCRSISEAIDGKKAGFDREDELMSHVDSLFGEVRDYFESLLGQLTGEFEDVTQYKTTESFGKKLERIFSDLQVKVNSDGEIAMPLIRVVTDLQNIRLRSRSALELVESLP